MQVFYYLIWLWFHIVNADISINCISVENYFLCFQAKYGPEHAIQQQSTGAVIGIGNKEEGRKQFSPKQ